ncbi:unnamed protein product [Phytophthora fragariaefolia]|uniref:Unnamed protein product n=1 Tax=Phytophthora fragariaefolia TaxID=1490495 RepID=A0A9W7D6F4_9STRA|nr:unnamed protein product [Phytophthora fragariaefolia]
MVCRLLNSLYGLKQAPNIWNKTLHAKLLAMGLMRLKSDYGLYVLKKDGEVTLLLTVYVDDLLLMGPRKQCEEVAAYLEETFEHTTMGTVKYLLGVEIRINKTRKQIVYSLRQYVLKVLKRFHMENCNGSGTPEATTPTTAEVPATKEYLPYRALVGALKYLINASRPDIAHATRHLGKYLACYDLTHYAQTKRVLRYLKATTDYGLVMDVQPGQGVQVCAYSDADYANDSVERRGISGYVTMLDNNVISYASWKQEINSLSTCEAEYVAMAEATKDLIRLAGLCKELGWKHPVPLLLGDNQGAIALTAKPGSTPSRNISTTSTTWCDGMWNLQRITTQHVSTDEMVADVMTKALGVVKFSQFRTAMKVLSLLGETSQADEFAAAAPAAAVVRLN